MPISSADSVVTVKPFDFDGISHDRYIAHDVEDRPYKRYKVTPYRHIAAGHTRQNSGVIVAVDSDEHDEFGYITESAQVRIDMVDKRMRKLELLRQELQEPWFTGEEDCEILMLAWGSTWGPVAEAVSMLNAGQDKKYGALVFGDIWPLPTGLLMEKCKRQGA